MTWKIPPLTMLTNQSSMDQWTSIDKRLAMAWVMLQRETCQKCGQPLWICRSKNNMLDFSVRKDVCYSTAKVEKWQSNKNNKLKDGEYPYAVPVMMNDEEFPTRAEYLESLED